MRRRAPAASRQRIERMPDHDRVEGAAKNLGGKIISAMASGLRSAVEFDKAHKGVRARLAFDI